MKGKIVQWHDEKGYGFIQIEDGNRSLFLYWQGDEGDDSTRKVSDFEQLINIPTVIRKTCFVSEVFSLTVLT